MNDEIGGQDFVNLYRAYREADNGCRAAISRALSPTELVTVPVNKPPAFYMLLRQAGIPYTPANRRQLARVVWMLPLAVHSEKNDHGGDIGWQLRDVARIVIDRMCLHTEDDEESLQQFRRALRISNQKTGTVYVDWKELGRRLYFWGDRIRDQIRIEYFMATC